MYTRRIDAALDALADCAERLPWLREAYGPGTPECAALDEVLRALETARASLRLDPRVSQK